VISIALDPDRVEAGDVLHAHIEWACSDGRPTHLDTSVYWFTEGRGDLDTGRVHSQRLSIDDRAMTGWTDVDIPVPGEGPTSYDGSLLRILWELKSELKIDGGRDETSIARLTVLPRRAAG